MPVLMSTSADSYPLDKQLRTNVSHIFAIGDIIAEPMLAHKASHEGKLAAEIIAGENMQERHLMPALFPRLLIPIPKSPGWA